MDRKTKAIILSVGIGTFMASLDSGVVNLAMPLIRADFGITLSMVEWIVTAYLLVVSSLLLMYGRMADMYGHKKVYMTGFVIFTVGSLLCGLSFHIGLLIASRVVQAIGAGMLFSTGPAIITNAVSPERRGKALSVTAIAVALGLSTGPVVGGVLSTLLGWQSIFFINIPIGVIGLLLVRKNIPKDEKKTAVPFDMAGSVMIFFALLLILMPLSLSGDYAIPAVLFISLIAAGLLLIVIFVLFELRCKHPMLNVRFFKNRTFAASNTAAVFIYMAQFIMVFLAPFYLQNLRGFSAMMSGFIYLPMPIATMCIAPISGSISDKVGSKYISAFGAFLMGCGLFMLSFLQTDTSVIFMMTAMIVTGLGFGMFQTPNNSAIMGSVPSLNRGTASGTLATMRNIGMCLGVAVSGALFSSLQNASTAELLAQGQSGGLLQNNAFINAMHGTFMAAAIVALLSMAASLVKQKNHMTSTPNSAQKAAEEKL